ncbi:tetratricopeptide repeat protein [Litorimonas sp. WD9-15]|uniref:tetratricopeptide repeat protein n=1 Tax=Litorimonas sp. WD9-15 TaxID=3418716 RepID=UPI003D08D8BC
MKRITTTLLALGLSVGAAHATETFSQDSLATALPTVDVQTLGNLSDCLNADMSDVSSRAIRACTKAYRASVPDYDIRSDLLTRRGLLRLSSGKVESATRDFDKAARLVDDNEFANLGLGFAALLENDAATAKARFADCADHQRAAPLAAYGLALTLEMSGDRAGAIAAYERALTLQPGWSMAQENLANLRAAI